MKPYSIVYRLEVSAAGNPLLKVETIASPGHFNVGDKLKLGGMTEFPGADGDFEIKEVSHFIYASDHRLVHETWLQVAPPHKPTFA